MAIDDGDEQIDREVLRTALRWELLDLDQLHEGDWNAMEHNPGGALHALASRPFAPAHERLEAARSRLAAVPSFLTAARERLHDLSRIHTETAIAQLAGTAHLIEGALPALAEEAGSTLGPEAEVARAAVEEHRAWLRDRLETADRNPRIGRDLFSSKLALALDTEFDPDALLARAEDDFERISGEIAAEAGRFAGVADPDAATVRSVMDELAGDIATDETILDLCRDAHGRRHGLRAPQRPRHVYDDPVEVDRDARDRPRRGGRLLQSVRTRWRQAPLPTAVRGLTDPEGLDARNASRSFYREYNEHMLHDLTVHEAMPGHALQLMHSNRHRGATPVRAVFCSGSFIEGWAVYAEELMADARLSQRRIGARCERTADAATEDAAAHDPQHDPRHPLPLPRPRRGRQRVG